jgi:CelD/BcsL family acetyltransferase involved in cellulose biosynthesis
VSPGSVQEIRHPESACSTEVRSWRDWATVAPHWQRLVRTVPVPSPFLSEAWVRTWLDVYGPQLQPEVVLFHADSAPVGCCLLTRRLAGWGPPRRRQFLLNTAGEDPADEVLVEYNDLPCLPGWEDAVAPALRRLLDARGWDELVLAGWQRSPALAALLRTFSDLPQFQTAKLCPFVQLASMRQRGVRFETTLSANTRHQVRRSRRLYEERGTLRVHEPASVAEALSALDRLAKLHQLSWRARGQVGAFASERFCRFHRALVERLFREGGVQLVEVSVGDTPIGVVYGLVLEGRVFFYQSGFSYEADNRLKPGLLTITETLQRALEDGFDEFDLMVGESRYKTSLARDSRELTWVRIERPGPRMRLVAMLRRMRRLLLRSEEPGGRSDEPNH